MKKFITAVTALPMLAVAHDGHLAAGLFHHAADGMIALAIVGIAIYIARRATGKR